MKKKKSKNLDQYTIQSSLVLHNNKKTCTVNFHHVFHTNCVSWLWFSFCISKIINGTELGVLVMRSRGFFPQAYWYWLGFGALFGFVWIFNILFVLALTFLDREFLSSPYFEEFSQLSSRINKVRKFCSIREASSCITRRKWRRCPKRWICEPSSSSRRW